MIVDALIGLLVGILNGLYSLLPSWTWGNYFTSTTFSRPGSEANMPFPADEWGTATTASPVTGIITMVSKWNIVLPIYECLIIINAVMTFAVAFAAWRGVAWLIGVIRGSGTSN